MRKVLLLLVLLLAFNGYNQSYSYRFNGKLDEAGQQLLLTELSGWNYFTEVKLRYKSDSDKGELLFTIPPKATPSEEEPPYSILSIKALLIRFGMAPDSFTERTN